MKLHVCVFLLLACGICIPINAQKKDSIIYVFNDKIEKKLYEHLEQEELIGNCIFYLTKIDFDKYKVYLSKSNEDNIDYWELNTNRYLIVKDKKYPLLFDYDMTFSTRKPLEILAYGEREGNVLRTSPIFEGYNLTFNLMGEIITEDYGIYIKREVLH